MSEKPFNLDEPYQTRGGHRAGVAQIAPNGFLYGWIDLGNNIIRECIWSASGRYSNNVITNRDLVNIPETLTLRFWVNVYEGSHLGGGNHYSRSVADQIASFGSQKGRKRDACLEIVREYTLGEGLDK